ncbi:MAG: hypothetical protein P8J20_00385 [Novosphingobium sp.]|nr:hypothetical protein [Novosphingobium sp.]
MTGQFIAKCRLPTGATNSIEIIDINESGCLANKTMMRMAVGDRVLLKLPRLEHMAAYITWVEEEQVGFTFETPLYGPVLQHMLAGISEPSAA